MLQKKEYQQLQKYQQHRQKQMLQKKKEYQQLQRYQQHRQKLILQKKKDTNNYKDTSNTDKN